MTLWNIAFIVLQTIFVFALGWFIRLLFLISRDHKVLEARVTELEKLQAVDTDRWRLWEKWMESIEKKINKLLER